MMKDHNPNFDFYSFNAPEQGKAEKDPIHQAQPEPLEQAEKIEPIVQESTEAVPVPVQETFEEDTYARDIDRAIARDKLRSSYSRLGWAFVAMTVAWYAVAQTLIDKVYTLAPHIYESYWFSILASTLPLYAVGLPLLYLIVRKLPTEVPEKKKLKLSHFLILFIISQTIMIAGSLMGESFVSFLGSLTGINFENSLGDTLDVPFWLSMLTTVICAPLFEELIFRKLIMDRMLPHGELAAIVVSSLLFGAFHGNFYQFFYAAMLGLLLAFVYARTGNFWNGVFLHMVINFFGGVVPTLISNWLDYDTFVTLSEEQILPYIAEHLGAYASLMGLALMRYGMAIAGLILLIVHFRKFTIRRRENQLPHSDALTNAFSNGGIIASLVTCGLLFGLWFLSAWVSTFAPMA